MKNYHNLCWYHSSSLDQWTLLTFTTCQEQNSIIPGIFTPLPRLQPSLSRQTRRAAIVFFVVGRLWRLLPLLFCVCCASVWTYYGILCVFLFFVVSSDTTEGSKVALKVSISPRSATTEGSLHWNYCSVLTCRSTRVSRCSRLGVVSSGSVVSSQLYVVKMSWHWTIKLTFFMIRPVM